MGRHARTELAVGAPCDLDSSHDGSEGYAYREEVEADEDLDQFLQVAEQHVTQVVLVREHVCVWPSRAHRIPGRLSLVQQHCVLFLAWLPYAAGTLQPDGRFEAQETAADGRAAAYAIHPVPLSEVRMVRAFTPRRLGLGWGLASHARLEVTLVSGITLPPLHFPPGQPTVATFVDAIRQHVQLVPCKAVPGAWMVNEVSDPLVRSLTALDLGDVLQGGPPHGGSAVTWAPPAPLQHTPVPAATSNDANPEHEPPVTSPQAEVRGWTTWAADGDTMWDVYGHGGAGGGGGAFPPDDPHLPLVMSGGPVVAALAWSALHAVTRNVVRLVQHAGSHAAWLATEWDEGDLDVDDSPRGGSPAPVKATAAAPLLSEETQALVHEAAGVPAVAETAEKQTAPAPETCGPGAAPKEPMSEDDDYEMVEAAALPAADAHHATPPPPLSEPEWAGMQDADGRLGSLALVHERVWAAGVAPLVRRDVWPVLLGLRGPRDTAVEVQAATDARRAEYQALGRQWRAVLTESQEPPTNTWWDSCARVDRDVSRTDRSHPMFAEHGAVGGRALRRLLLAYITLPGSRPYCQGMSDLAAPLLVVLRDESEAFWAFVALMDRWGPNFEHSQAAMHAQLAALRRLLQLVDPQLHAHLEDVGCSDAFFAFRWLLIAFKREFKYADVLRLWEAAWACPVTPHLPLYLAAAVLVHHRRAILSQVADFDAMLKFCVRLAGELDLAPLLRLAATLVAYVGRAADDVLESLATSIGISPELRAAGGLDPTTQPQEQAQGYEESLRAGFLPVALRTTPGLRILNIDPPVMTIEHFVSQDICQRLIDCAAGSGRMQVSRVGGATGSTLADASIRTSSTMPLTRETLAALPELKLLLQAVLDAAAGLLHLPAGKRLSADGIFSPPSGPGHILPELPQITRYLPGQHFLSHEDAFPPQVARQKGYQRRATLLVYLNDVAEGGATRFDRLGFQVQPAAGRALLFFPAFSGGMPDARTLHTATDAVSEKWILQLWISSGLAVPGGAVRPSAAAGRPNTSSRPNKRPSQKRR